MRARFLFSVVVFAAACFAGPAAAQCESASVCSERSAGDAVLIEAGLGAGIWYDTDDYPGVVRAVRDLQQDLTAVAGREASIGALQPTRGPVIIVGTLGRSDVIDRLVREGKLDVSGVRGTWEGFVHQVVERPVRGVDRALVIAGADMRGTIFGLYDLSERIGVSPWSWWADVPVERQDNLYFTAGRRADWPRVRYRGIFLNDENPALYGWVNERFGGFNAQFYEHVFELILRLKGNYLWPAMWGKAIYDDDPRSPELANEMGVVLGTSHHEPLTRAHVEWERYGEHTPWDYNRNAERLRAFWRTGIERMGDNESIVTIGMRGDGDEAMTEETAIPLLERIVRDQRQIIADVTGRPASEQPQIWALYKEVQDYYDQGMEVPDDVTLLFADDNWGNIRRLPDLGRTRPGGYGVYYHFDYVGGPRNYKWLNTNQIERVWEQMHLAREYGADRIWIVNVGDLKPMEFPIDFFLDYAWNPEAWPLERLPEYTRLWASEQFGAGHAEEIAELLTRYTQFNARRKPEMINPTTFSQINFREADRIVADWNALAARAEHVGAQLGPEYQSAYFQLVLHPILASANLNEMYVLAGRNRLYAEQGRASTNAMAERVEALFARDAQITQRYHTINGGKWNHMMSQTHIGYTTWQQPDRDVMPEVRRIDVPARAPMGVVVEGEERLAPGARRSFQSVLPELSPFGAQSTYIDVFRRGAASFRFTASTPRDWVRLSQREGELGDDVRIEVTVDWDEAPRGVTFVPITLRGAGSLVTVQAHIVNPDISDAAPNSFVEANGVVAMEAAHFSRAVNGGGVAWREIPELGRTLSGVSAFPRTASAQTPGGASPRLEYDVHLFNVADVEVQVILAPTMNFTGRGLRYAVSIDDEPPQIVNVHMGANGRIMHSGESDATWERWVGTNSNVQSTQHEVAAPGAHVVKVWMVDPGLVFERVLVVTEDLPQTYLGPPESRRVSAETTTRN